MKVFPYSKQVVQAFILVFLLAFASLSIERQFRNDEQSVKMVPVSSNYVWNFNSGLTMAQGFASNDHEIIAFSTEGIRIDAVLGESTNIEATCSPSPCEEPVFGYAGVGIPIYAHQTYSVRIWKDMNSNTWLGRIIYNSSVFGWRDLELQMQNMNLENISEALTQDISLMQDLHFVNESYFETMKRNQIHLNNTEIRIQISFTDGTLLYISIIQDMFFLRVTYFTEYFSNREGTRYRVSEQPDEYYIATEQVHFPTYTKAVNNLIELLLEE